MFRTSSYRLTRALGFGMLILLLASTPSLAQQESAYTQYMFNRLLVNPAYAGTRLGGQLTAFYRNQYTGIEGAPRTFNFSGHAQLPGAGHGLGGYVVHDRIGNQHRTTASVAFAYRIKSPKGVFSMGVNLGVIHQGWRAGDFQFDIANDPSLGQAAESSVVPNIGLGAFYNNGRFYAGFSVNNLYEFDISPFVNPTTPDAGTHLARHYYLTAGYDIYLNKNVIMTPSALLRATRGAVNFDVNTNFLFNERFWLGATYRHEDAVGFLAGLYVVPEKFRIGYSYDVVLNDLRPGQSGTHEVMLSYLIGPGPNSKEIKTPRYFN